MDQTTVELNGVRIYTRRVGDGPPVVVLHGGPGAHHDYLLPQYDRLALGRTLLYYDQRGGGRSPVPRDTPVGWREHVADLEALRDRWGLERVTLLGYSWGGLLAVLYALEHPARIGRLALVSSAPITAAWRDEFDRRLAARMTQPWIARARAELTATGLSRSEPEKYRRLAFALSVAGYFHDPSHAREMTPFRVTARTQQEVWPSPDENQAAPRRGPRDPHRAAPARPQDRRPAGAGVPRCHLRAAPRERAPAAGGDHPVGPIDRRTRQPGHPRPVREVPLDAGSGERRPGGAGAGDPQHRVLPQQDQVHHRDGPGTARAPRGRGTRHHGGPGPAPGRRPQDRERGTRHLVPEERRDRGGHTRAAPVHPARPHARDGSRENRAGPDGAGAARPVDLVLAHADPARAAGVHRAAAQMRDLCHKPVVPELASMNRHTTLRRYVVRLSITYNVASYNV